MEVVLSVKKCIYLLWKSQDQKYVRPIVAMGRSEGRHVFKASLSEMTYPTING